MHGGQIIKARFFRPSDRLPGYKVPTAEYDFSAANEKAGLAVDASGINLFHELKNRCLSKIEVSGNLAEAIETEGLHLYRTMAQIYDVMAAEHPVAKTPKCDPAAALIVVGVLLLAVAVLINYLHGEDQLTCPAVLPGPGVG